MKDRELRKVKAGMAAAARMAISLAGLALACGGPVRAQEAGGETNSQAGQVVTAYLDYRAVDYSFVNWGLSVTQRYSAFPKEPALSGGKIIRGVMQLGSGGSNAMAFVWDRTGRKLYLDLNRNLDLTDDAAGVFSCQKGPTADYYQEFTNIALPFQTAVGERQGLVDLHMQDFGSFMCSVAMRSFWQGKATLYGQEWQVGLPENPFNLKGFSQPVDLVLRPWSQHNSPFTLHSGSQDGMRFSSNLFVGEHAYRFSCTNAVEGGVGKMQARFVEQQPKLGELKITGQYVQRLTLGRGPFLVVLDNPGPTARVPVGRYDGLNVWLKKGGTEAYLDSRTQQASQRITVSERLPAVLTVGGPLTNTVSIAKEGRRLAFAYRVVGAGGAYELANQDRLHPPEFTVYQGDKKMAAGKFQYG